MSADAFAARCTAAGLTVLDAQVVGKQVRVTVKPYNTHPTQDRTQTIVKKLGVPVTVSFGDGRGNVALWFWAE